MMTRLSLLIGCLAAAFVFLTADQATAKTFQFRTTNEYAVESGFRLGIVGTSGSISISQRPGDKVVVETIKEINASSREQAEEIEDRLEVEIKADRNSIDINSRFPEQELAGGFWARFFGLHHGLTATVDLVIEVPTSVEIEISATSGDTRISSVTGSAVLTVTSGDVDISDFAGDCEVQTTSGDLRFKDIRGDLRASSTSADALFDNVEGNLTLRSTSGETEIRWISGSTQITKTSGDVRIESASGDVDVKTTSGDVEVLQREGGVCISTSSGDVRVHSDATNGKLYEIETISGDITLEVPSEMKGNVKLATVSGEINTDLSIEVRSFNQNRLEGRIGGDGPDVRLNSTAGDISLEGF